MLPKRTFQQSDFKYTEWNAKNDFQNAMLKIDSPNSI